MAVEDVWKDMDAIRRKMRMAEMDKFLKEAVSDPKGMTNVKGYGNYMTNVKGYGGKAMTNIKGGLTSAAKAGLKGGFIGAAVFYGADSYLRTI